LLDTLRQLKLDEKTLVIFTSDNGGQTSHGAVNAPLRAGKGTTFEGGMREPTIAWWPQHIPAGTETAAVTSMMDVLPTFIKLAGGSVPSDRKIDGGDIWPILAGDADARSPHETFYYFRGYNLQAVRHGPWKLHLANGELYNLETDIGESRDAAQQYPDTVAQLRRLADEMQGDLGTSEIGPGCRPLGKVKNARPLIDHDGQVREGFEAPQS
jgi:arylsulfatase A-like enzyme